MSEEKKDVYPNPNPVPVNQIISDSQNVVLIKLTSENIDIINRFQNRNITVIDTDVYQIQQKEERESKLLEHEMKLKEMELNHKMELDKIREQHEFEINSKRPAIFEAFELISNTALKFSVFGAGLYLVLNGELITGNFLLGGALYTICKDYVLKFGKKLIG